MAYRHVTDRPVPIWFGVLETDTLHSPPERFTNLADLDLELLRCDFRGVSIDRLDAVLTSGIDVQPTNSVLFASTFNKAWEYGGFPKVLMALDTSGMSRTWTKRSSEEISQPELDELSERYPTVVERNDGKDLWFSRLPEDDPRVATQYETAHAWWIPGDPFDVLRAIFIFGSESELSELELPPPT